MLKRALTREFPRHLRVGLVAGFDGLKVTHRSAGLEDSTDTLFDAPIGAGPEGEKGI